MLENSRTRAARGHQGVSHSLPNFHYSQKLPSPSPSSLKNPQQHPSMYASPSKVPMDPQECPQASCQYQTGQALRRYANTLLKNSPYNNQSTYHRYYTEPDNKLNEEYNQYNGVRFHGKIKLGKIQTQTDQKFNRFDGRTTYRDNYGIWNRKGSTKTGDNMGLFPRNNANKPIEYSHSYGKQTISKSKQIPQRPSYKLYQGEARLQTETEYRKNFKKPEQKPLIIKNQQSQQKHHKSVSDFTDQVRWLSKVTGFKNRENKRYSEPHQDVMGKYYLSNRK